MYRLKSITNSIGTLVIIIGLFPFAMFAQEGYEKKGIDASFPRNMCEYFHEDDIRSAKTEADRYVLENILGACKVDKTRVILTGSLDTLLNNAFRSNNGTLLEVTFAMFPRTPKERKDFTKYVLANEKPLISRLTQRNTNLSKYLLVRHYLEKYNQPISEEEKKEIYTTVKKILKTWDSQHPLTPYIDSWTYFSFGESPFLTSSRKIVEENRDIGLYRQSMKIVWYTKEALLQINKKDKSGFIDSVNSIKKILKDTKNTEFTGFFGRNFSEKFRENPEFLDSSIFSNEYIEFIKATILLHSINPEEFNDSHVSALETIISFGESEKIDTDPIMETNLFSRNGIYPKVKPILFSYARKDFQTVEKIIVSHKKFFSREEFNTIHDEIKKDILKSRNGPTPVMEGFLKEGEKINPSTEDNKKNGDDSGKPMQSEGSSIFIYILTIFSLVISALYVILGKSKSRNQQGNPSEDNNRGGTSKKK